MRLLDTVIGYAEIAYPLEDEVEKHHPILSVARLKYHFVQTNNQPLSPCLQKVVMKYTIFA